MPLEIEFENEIYSWKVSAIQSEFFREGDTLYVSPIMKRELDWMFYWWYEWEDLGITLKIRFDVIIERTTRNGGVTLHLTGNDGEIVRRYISRPSDLRKAVFDHYFAAQTKFMESLMYGNEFDDLPAT